MPDSIPGRRAVAKPCVARPSRGVVRTTGHTHEQREQQEPAEGRKHTLRLAGWCQQVTLTTLPTWESKGCLPWLFAALPGRHGQAAHQPIGAVAVHAGFPWRWRGSCDVRV